MRALAHCTAGLAASLLISCGNGPPSPNETILRRGLSGEPASLDPLDATDNFSVQVIQDLYEGLLQEGPNGEITPGVATSWTVDTSGKEYKFELRPDALWSNGQRVRASDFVRSWERTLDPRSRSPVANDLRLISGASAIISGNSPPTSLKAIAKSDTELVVELEQPAPFFPQLLAHPSTFAVFSNEAAKSHKSQTWISNGAYVLSAWQPGSKLGLVKNQRYWDRDNVHIQKVEYVIATDPNAQYAQYRAGQLDVTDGIPSNALSVLRAERPSEVVIAPYSAVAYIGLNMTKPPFAGNQKLRQAMFLAIDRKNIVETLAAGQLAAFTIVPPGIWNYQSVPAEGDNLHDIQRLDKARELYKEAGYSAASPLHIRLLFNSSPSIKQTVALIAAMWKDVLGIETSFSDEEFKVFLQSRKERERWEAIRLAWNADYNDASNFLDIFRSKSPNNDTGYANSKFDATLDTATTTESPDARRELLQNAEKLLLADYAAIPIYFFVSKHLVKPYLHGLKPNAFDRIRSQTLTLVAH